jgi:hypothetical protein
MIALAQQAGARVAAAVGELREIDGDDGEAVEVAGQRFGPLMAVEPDADWTAASDDLVAPRQPDRQRQQHRPGRQGDRCRRLALGQGEDLPVVVDDARVPDDPRH